MLYVELAQNTGSSRLHSKMLLLLLWWLSLHEAAGEKFEYSVVTLLGIVIFKQIVSTS